MTWVSAVDVGTALLFAPLFLAVVRRVKAIVGGRRGPPLLQPYYDLQKLLRKGVVYSRTTTFLFAAGPILGLAVMLTATLMVPFAGARTLIHFQGDVVLLAYLFALARFFTVVAALDTGSSFEAMGASREVQFGLLAEPALFLGLITLARRTDSLSLSEIYYKIDQLIWVQAAPEILLVVVAFFVVLLAENSRIPVDDPTTHLELTMVHEVMVLDHSGPDLAFIQYGAALKLWLFGALVSGLLIPARSAHPAWNWLEGMAAMAILAVVVGLVESLMARLRLTRVPQLLLGAAAASALALVLVAR